MRSQGRSNALVTIPSQALLAEQEFVVLLSHHNNVL